MTEYYIKTSLVKFGIANTVDLENEAYK